jgi:hypothetical protein
MPHRRFGLILVFLLSAGQSFCDEVINADFFRDLNTVMSQLDIFGDNTHEGLLLFPGVYFSRKYGTYAGLGFMIDSTEMLREYEEEEYTLHQADTLMRLALYFRRRKANLTLLFNYHRDRSWGISFKVKI